VRGQALKEHRAPDLAPDRTTMMIFHDYLPSQNAWKVRQLLHHLQRPHHTRHVGIFEGEGRREAFLRLNPTGTVPAIELDDGRALGESNAILCFLADGTRYLPEDAFGRAKVWQWLSFEQERIESQVGALRYWTLTGKLARRAPALVAAKRKSALRALEVLDAQFAQRDFIAGDGYTVADIALFAYASRADEADGLSLAAHPHLRAWIDRVRAQPRVLDESFAYSIDPHSAGELP
jgi:glutathione S-transferase